MSMPYPDNDERYYTVLRQKQARLEAIKDSEKPRFEALNWHEVPFEIIGVMSEEITVIMCGYEFALSPSRLFILIERFFLKDPLSPENERIISDRILHSVPKLRLKWLLQKKKC